MTTEEHLEKIVAKCRELLAADAGSDRAKAGWRATIAMCEWMVDSGYCESLIADSIIAAWPKELL